MRTHRFVSSREQTPDDMSAMSGWSDEHIRELAKKSLGYISQWLSQRGKPGTVAHHRSRQGIANCVATIRAAARFHVK